MRILYVGELWSGATASMRFDALVGLGHDLIGVNVLETTYANKRNLLTRAAERVFRVAGRRRRINAELIYLAGRANPDVIWVDKGTLILAETLRRLRAQEPRPLLVHFNPDDPFGVHRQGWETFLAGLSLYDVHFVPRKENISEYREVGAKDVVYQLPARGFDLAVHYPRRLSAVEKQKYASEICFVGGYELYRAQAIEHLARHGFGVSIWGPRDSRWPRHPLLRYGKAFYRDEYAKLLSGAKIALGFLRRGNRDQHTSRSIEIPACGTLLLAERTGEHLALFEEGREADFFGSLEELGDKCAFYLKHDRAREQVAAAGLRRCVRSGYDYRTLMGNRVDYIANLGRGISTALTRSFA